MHSYGLIYPKGIVAPAELDRSESTAGTGLEQYHLWMTRFEAAEFC